MKPLCPGEVPKALLLGNGINRCFENSSWDGLLKEMSKRDEKDWENIKNLPYPLMAVAAVGDDLGDEMKLQACQMCSASVSEEQKALMHPLGQIGVEAILTTNYSYEIEKVLDESFTVAVGKASKYRCKTCKDKPKKDTSSLFQFMNMTAANKSIPIWHIHGEAAKPDTMVIGHYYYGKLLYRIEKYASDAIKRYKIAQQQGLEFYPRSWVDYLLFGDVYIVGLGLDFSEMDLWWLINCKKRNGIGKVYFYEPNLSMEKKVLIEAYGVENISLEVEDDNYKGYYKQVIKHINEHL